VTAKTDHTAFAALRHSGFRSYFVLTAIAMMGDNIEHVISYWVLFQKFHSPALGGFAVVSHWAPFLLGSIWAGALTDRFDPRRMIQLGMALFAVCSFSWGLLFFSHSLQLWHAVVLLLLHGCSGVLWGPASQVLLHDIVGPEHLQSAVRLNATARLLGILAGPAVGGALLLGFGPACGIFVNASLYLPFVIWLIRAPYGPAFRADPRATPHKRAVASFGELFSAIREVSHHPVIVGMTALAGGTALLIGNAYQAQMPNFAADLGHGAAGIYYSVLLAADAAGAVTAAVLLESMAWLQPAPRLACWLAIGWALALGGFALSHLYLLSVALLFAAGFTELSFNAMAQTLVQLDAPPQMRGRAIGVYSMFAMGMRTFSGLSVGLLGAQIGIHLSLAASALVLIGLLSVLQRRLRGAATVAPGHGS